MKNQAVRQQLYKLVLLTSSVIISLVACELALQAFSSEYFYVRRPGIKVITRPLPGVMPGISGESRFFINSFGIRGEPFSDDQRYRILAIGGSTTECFYLDESEAWPNLLQQALNAKQEQTIWIGNVGKSGNNSRHHIVQVRNLLKQYPRINAIIVLVGVNDFHQRVARGQTYRPFPLFEELSPGSYNALLQTSFEVCPPNFYAGLPFYRRTELWERLRKVKWYCDLRELHQDKAGKIYMRWRQHRKSAPAIRAQLPDLTSSLQEYAQNLRTIIKFSRENNVRVIFITQPTMWKPGMSKEELDLMWMGGDGNYFAESGHEYYAIETLAAGMKKYNETLLTVCQQNNVECVDLASQLPKDTSIYYDDCHFNENGSLQVANVLSQYLLQEGRLKLLNIK